MDNLQGGMIALEHRYTVGQLRRRAGFESLYEGIQDPFDRPVWIHVYELMAPAHTRDALVERLRASAHASSHAEIPGLLRAIDHGEIDEGVPFVVTERARGPSLEEILEREGTLSLEETAELIARLAALLEPLHLDGQYHGSISPAWIFVARDAFDRATLGHVELGLDLREQRALTHAVLTPDALLPIPPEAFSEEPPDEDDALALDHTPAFNQAGDVWALGALAYTCLVGMHPFFQQEHDPSEGMIQILSGAPQPLSEMGLDEGVSDVIARALHPDPQQRWTSVGALSRALTRATAPDTTPDRDDEDASPQTSPAPAPPARRARDADPLTDRRSQIAGAAILVALVTNIAWAMFALTPRTSPSPQPDDTPAASPPPLTLSSTPEDVEVLAIDGEQERSLGNTPLELELERPTQQLKLSHPGYRDSSVEVRVTPGGQNFRIILEKQD